MRPYHILLPDLHHPEHNRKAWATVLEFIAKNRSRIASVIFMGDNQDCSQFSHHNDNKPGLIRKGGIQEDMDTFTREVLDQVETRIDKSCEKVFLLGNHEDWMEQWLEKNPAWTGAVSIEKFLNLRPRGWKVVQQGGSHMIGKLLVLHGDSVGTGQYVAKKLVETHCNSAVMGHVHTFSVFTKCAVARKRDKWIGVTLPTLGTLTPNYGNGAPNQWLTGFGIVERYGEDGFFNLYVPVMIDGQFSFAGEVYGRN